jgi:hypothetical protein
MEAFRSNARPPFIDKSDDRMRSLMKKYYLTFQGLLHISVCSLMLFGMKDSLSNSFMSILSQKCTKNL